MRPSYPTRSNRRLAQFQATAAFGRSRFGERRWPAWAARLAPNRYCRMKNVERIAEELSSLLDDGNQLLKEGQKKDVSLGKFGPRYESWYTKALAAVTQII